MSGQRAEPAWTDAFGELWGSYLQELRVSLPLHRVVMTVWVKETVEGTPDHPRPKTTMTWYELTFEGVIRFVFADSDTNPWWATELTAIGKRDREGRTEYGFDLTGNEDALLITCEEARVTLLQTDE